MTQLWRLNIEPENKETVDPRKFCLENRFLGVGWGLKHYHTGVAWDEYWTAAKKQFSENRRGVNATRLIKEELKMDDLCWTRDRSGIYYVGRVIGDWQYIDDQEHLDADIINLRSCHWVKVGVEDEVPGDVVRSFTRASFQRVNNRSLRVSQHIYNQGSSDFKYPIEKANESLFGLLSAFDCEDIVGMYLQHNEGYRLVPSSCKNSTSTYEYVLRHPQNGQSAVAQVKSGVEEGLNRDGFSDLAKETKVYLFATSGKYLGEANPNIICLTPNEVEDFAVKNKKWMPPRIQKWMDIWQHFKV